MINVAYDWCACGIHNVIICVHVHGVCNSKCTLECTHTHVHVGTEESDHLAGHE